MSYFNRGDPKQKKLEWLCAQTNTDVGSTPKYQRVLNVLIKGISDGIWQVGDKLPTEAELTRVLSFSYGTVQKAYQILEDKGLVLRHRGSGSYVANALHEMTKPWHCRFLDEEDNILPVFPEIIGSENKIHAPSALKILGSKTEIGRIDRKLQIGNEFVVFSRFYAASDIIQSLLYLSRSAPDGTNFKSLLLHEIGRPVVSIAQTIMQSQIAPDIAVMIGCHSKSLGFQIEAIAHDHNNIPVYYQVLDIPPTTRRLLFESIYQGSDLPVSE